MNSAPSHDSREQASDAHASDGHDAHAVGLKLYFAVFAALLAGTWLTVWVAEHDFGAWNTPLALGIACTKASLVILYFMHVRWSPKLVWLAASIGLVFLVILLGFTISDYATREWLEIYSEPLKAR